MKRTYSINLMLFLFYVYMQQAIGVEDTEEDTTVISVKPIVEFRTLANGRLRYDVKIDDCKIWITVSQSKREKIGGIMFLRVFCDITIEDVVRLLRVVVSQTDLEHYFNKIGTVIYGMRARDIKHMKPLMLAANESAEWRRYVSKLNEKSHRCDGSEYQKLLMEADFFSPLRIFFTEYDVSLKLPETMHAIEECSLISKDDLLKYGWSKDQLVLPFYPGNSSMINLWVSE